jgi:hypothetical protein
MTSPDERSDVGSSLGLEEFRHLADRSPRPAPLSGSERSAPELFDVAIGPLA